MAEGGGGEGAVRRRDLKNIPTKSNNYSKRIHIQFTEGNVKRNYFESTSKRDIYKNHKGYNGFNGKIISGYNGLTTNVCPRVNHKIYFVS